jgi:peptidoglycan/xylan/chitin deacetylase (PgdA/CDA1 family)
MQRSLVNAVKASVRGLVSPALLKCGYFDRALRSGGDRAVVLMYHRVTEPLRSEGSGPGYPVGVRPGVFERQIAYIASQMHPIGMLDLVRALERGDPVPPGTVAVTFDDGYHDNYLHAYPVLRHYGVPATLFLATGHVGTDRAFWWERVIQAVLHTKVTKIDVPSLLGIAPHRRGAVSPALRSQKGKAHAIQRLTEILSDLPAGELGRALERVEAALGAPGGNVSPVPMLSWNEVRAMASNGIEVGAHTVTHPNLARISMDAMVYEISTSKSDIESRVGQPVYGFAVPYGQAGYWSAATVSAVRAAGFRYMCLASQGVVQRGSDPFSIDRVSVPDSLELMLWKMRKYGTRARVARTAPHTSSNGRGRISPQAGP